MANKDEKLPAIDEGKVEQLHTTAALLSENNHNLAALNQTLGEVRMADAFGKFSQTVWASKMAHIKESKQYRLLKGQKTPNGLELKGTWAEFCEMAGVSDEKANQDIANLKAFGEQALESMSRMGIGYREMRQYRKLPSDQQEALIEVAKTNDKESFVELAEEIISKNTKEKEALKQEAESKAADYEAINEVLEKKSASLAKAEQELAKAKQVLKKQTPDEVLTRLKTEVAAEFIKVSSAIGSELRSALQQISAHSEANGQDINLWLYDHVRGLEAQLSDLGLEFAIQPDFTEFEEA